MHLKLNTLVLGILLVIIYSTSVVGQDIFYVIETGTYEQLKNLLEQGVDPNQLNDEGKTPLIKALFEANNFKKAELLIEYGADINGKDGKGITPLMYASYKDKYIDIVKFLIKHKVDVNEGSLNGWTPLALAAIYNQKADTARVLIEAGAEVNIEVDGLDLFMMALARTDSPEIIKAFVEHGRNVNTRFKHKTTPLMIACGYNDNEEIIYTLLELGANPLLKDEIGNTAADYILNNEALSSSEITQLLQNFIGGYNSDNKDFTVISTDSIAHETGFGIKGRATNKNNASYAAVNFQIFSDNIMVENAYNILPVRNKAVFDFSWVHLFDKDITYGDVDVNISIEPINPVIYVNGLRIEILIIDITRRDIQILVNVKNVSDKRKYFDRRDVVCKVPGMNTLKYPEHYTSELYPGDIIERTMLSYYLPYGFEDISKIKEFSLHYLVGFTHVEKIFEFKIN